MEHKLIKRIDIDSSFCLTIHECTDSNTLCPIYSFRYNENDSTLLLYCDVQTVSTNECFVYGMFKKGNDFGLRDIAKFRPLFRHLKFESIYFKRSLNGHMHKISI